jgi:hypothetical protein
VERKIKSYEYALDKAIENEADSEIIDDFVAKLDGLAQDKRKLEKERKAILNKRQNSEEENKAIESFRNWCAEIREKIDDPSCTFTYQEKRRAFERFGIKATVWRKDHNPRYKIAATATDIATAAS